MRLWTSDVEDSLKPPLSGWVVQADSVTEMTAVLAKIRLKWILPPCLNSRLDDRAGHGTSPTATAHPV